MQNKTFTCNTCGTTGSLRWMDQHDCQAVQDVRQFGGHCEDFPCCGHQPGECEPREEYTKAYWLERMSGDFDYDYDEEDIPHPDDCKGHPAGPNDPMGETVYCDGSCLG